MTHQPATTISEFIADARLEWITMDASKKPLHWAETLAVLYLAVPLLILFTFFIRVEIAIPGDALLIFLFRELISKTSWRELVVLRWETFYFLLLAIIWAWLSGGFGPLEIAQNSDWGKHNLVINFLAEHSWPASEEFTHFGNLTLRYYIGWHLVPASILKVFHTNSSPLVASIWSIAGVFILFNLLPDLVGYSNQDRGRPASHTDADTNRTQGRELMSQRALIVAAPLTFILFGGADFIGTQITHHSAGPIHHFEWWSGWAQFSSNTTAFFWCPNQALAAWLPVAILMRTRHRDILLPYCGLIASAALLWSPLATIGQTPFVLALIVQYGPRSVVFGWRAIGSATLLAFPVGLYLLSGSGAIPHGYIGTSPCTNGLPCFTWSSYLLFLAIEIGAPLLVLFSKKESERGFLVAATCALCLIPLYKFGVFNDFAMRASLPSLAVIAILCAKLFSGPGFYRIAAFLVLTLAFPSVLGELSRGFLPQSKPPVVDLAATDDSLRWWIDQTFAPQPIEVLR